MLLGALQYPRYPMASDAEGSGVDGIRVVWSSAWRSGRGGRGAARAERVQEVTERAGILRRPYASHKPYNMGRVAVFIDLNR